MGSAYPSSSRSPFISYACIFLAVFFILSNAPCEAQLSSKFYDNTCPKALSTIRTAIRTAVSRERRMAASLIRLHFHDCFVQVFINSHASNSICSCWRKLLSLWINCRAVMHQSCLMIPPPFKVRKMHPTTTIQLEGSKS